MLGIPICPDFAGYLPTVLLSRLMSPREKKFSRHQMFEDTYGMKKYVRHSSHLRSVKALTSRTRLRQTGAFPTLKLLLALVAPRIDVICPLLLHAILLTRFFGDE